MINCKIKHAEEIRSKSPLGCGTSPGVGREGCLDDYVRQGRVGRKRHHPFSPTGSQLLFQFCSDRYERGRLLITSNLEFARWTECLATRN